MFSNSRKGNFQMKRVIQAVLFGALVIGLFAVTGATPALATALPPGATVSVSAETGSFTSLASTGPQSFSFSAHPRDSGKVEEWVGNFTGNPLKGLTFVYQFTVSGGVIEHISGSSFSGFLVDVGDSKTCDFASGSCLAATGNKGPVSANRTGDGAVVEFNFLPEVTKGDRSFELLVNTNATAYIPGSIGLIDGGGQTLDGFAPAPEPGTLTLFGSGLIGLAGLMRRKLVRA
jgi:hypothetical protein